MNDQLIPTAGQTVGPFFGYALPYDGGPEIVPPYRPNAVRLSGTVFDGDEQPVPDALVEIWQPDENGEIVNRRGSLHRDGHTFTGFGRSATNLDGSYQFSTVLPGVLQGSASAPFFAVILFARGLTDRLRSRIYLPGSDEVLAADPLLSSLPAGRRHTLVATTRPDGSLHHDFHLQGENETVFLDFG